MKAKSSDLEFGDALPEPEVEYEGFVNGEDVSICLDVAANELKVPKDVQYFLDLVKKYPIKSIEDPFSEDEWYNWKNFRWRHH